MRHSEGAHDQALSARRWFATSLAQPGFHFGGFKTDYSAT